MVGSAPISRLRPIDCAFMDNIKTLRKVDRSVAIPVWDGMVEQSLMIFTSEVVWAKPDNAAWIDLGSKLRIGVPPDMLVASVAFIIGRNVGFSLTSHARRENHRIEFRNCTVRRGSPAGNTVSALIDCSRRCSATGIFLRDPPPGSPSPTVFPAARRVKPLLPVRRFGRRATRDPRNRAVRNGRARFREIGPGSGTTPSAFVDRCRTRLHQQRQVEPPPHRVVEEVDAVAENHRGSGGGRREAIAGVGQAGPAVPRPIPFEGSRLPKRPQRQPDGRPVVPVPRVFLGLRTDGVTGCERTFDTPCALRKAEGREAVTVQPDGSIRHRLRDPVAERRLAGPRISADAAKRDARSSAGGSFRSTCATWPGPLSRPNAKA